ncbi:MAG: STAS domain-containing protein [Candidatus Hydrogenedentes bacterium]|nr:STAS domain-containing protein [Candidatus Hydrogenedentota bacterium]
MNNEAMMTFEEYGKLTVGTIQKASVLDALNVTRFGEEVLGHVKAHPGVNLMLDFHRVDYLSSAVLTELLRINEAVREAQGTLRLCSLNEDIRKVFEITNLNKILIIYDALEDALRRYARSLEVAAQEDAWSHVNRNP